MSDTLSNNPVARSACSRLSLLGPFCQNDLSPDGPRIARLEGLQDLLGRRPISALQCTGVRRV